MRRNKLDQNEVVEQKLTIKSEVEELVEKETWAESDSVASCF